MSRSSLLLLCISLAVCACSVPHEKPGTVKWARTFGELGVSDLPLLAVDAAGHIGLASSYSSTPLQIGSTKLPSPHPTASFIATLGSDGKPRWALPIAGTGDKIVSGLAATPEGNWIACGTFTGTLDVGEGAVSKAVDADMFLLALDPMGKPLWHRHFGADLGGPAGVGNLVPRGGLAITPSGDIAVVGVFSGTVGFGGPPLDPDAMAGASMVPRPFIAMLDAAGNERWALAMTGDALSDITMTVDGEGSVLVAGAYTKRIRLGELALTTRSDSGAVHGFVGKVSPGGKPRWLVDIADSQFAIVKGVATDTQGNVTVTGGCTTTLRVGGLEGGPCAVFVLSLSPEGDPRWLHAVYPSLDASAVTAGSDGDVMLTGTQTVDRPDFGRGPLPDRETPGFYLATYDSAGKAVESFAFGPMTTNSAGQAITNVSDDEVAIAGSCGGSLGIGGIDPKDPHALDGLFLARIVR